MLLFSVNNINWDRVILKSPSQKLHDPLPKKKINWNTVQALRGLFICIWLGTKFPFSDWGFGFSYHTATQSLLSEWFHCCSSVLLVKIRNSFFFPSNFPRGFAYYLMYEIVSFSFQQRLITLSTNISFNGPLLGQGWEVTPERTGSRERELII